MRQILSKKRAGLFIGLVFMAACILAGVGSYHVYKPLPAGLSFAGPFRPADEIAFYKDLTWVDSEGRRHCRQEIFDKVLDMIANARHLVVLDMFLFNDFIGKGMPPHRMLAREITDGLVARKTKDPELRIIVITDPINTVYGSMPNPYFEKLEAHNIRVVMTDLTKLRDSNPAYSVFWRIFVKPFGSGSGELLPNPFGRGRVSLRSYLAMFNFKANHRKVIICDTDDGYEALITSANPHDGSSAHGNAAIYFRGQAALDLLQTEEAVPGFSGDIALPPYSAAKPPESEESGTMVRIVSESRIKDALLTAINRAGARDSLAVVVFYLADREIIGALKEAFSRGAEVRVLLDPNKDAFGRKKNGIPNRQAATELVKSGIPVRWSNTHGEQAHAKILLADYRDGQGLMITGSANFTRRNLADLNLETDIEIRGPQAAPVFTEAGKYIDLLWHNTDGRKFSVAYSEYADNAFSRRLLYRWMEATGMSTF